MAYLQPADMRPGSAAWFATDIMLTTTDITDAQLTSAIAAFSDRFDFWTHDHYAPGSVGEVLTVDGDGTRDLYLPKRIMSVTQVQTQPWAGTLNTESATVYRVVSSVQSGVRTVDDEDLISIIPWSVLSTGYPWWPQGVGTVLVTGQFGWATTPGAVQRAVALLCWDQAKNENPDLRRASRFTTNDAVFEQAATKPTGMLEVDQIVAEYTRDDPYF